MTEEQIEWLRENLSLDVSEESHYNYCGGDSAMYKYTKNVKLILCGEVISSVSFE